MYHISFVIRNQCMNGGSMINWHYEISVLFIAQGTNDDARLWLNDLADSGTVRYLNDWRWRQCTWYDITYCVIHSIARQYVWALHVVHLFVGHGHSYSALLVHCWTRTLALSSSCRYLALLPHQSKQAGQWPQRNVTINQFLFLYELSSSDDEMEAIGSRFEMGWWDSHLLPFYCPLSSYKSLLRPDVKSKQPPFEAHSSGYNLIHSVSKNDEPDGPPARGTHADYSSSHRSKHMCSTQVATKHTVDQHSRYQSVHVREARVMKCTANLENLPFANTLTQTQKLVFGSLDVCCDACQGTVTLTTSFLIRYFHECLRW